MVIFKLGQYKVSLEDSKYSILENDTPIKVCNNIKEAVFFINNKTKHLL